MAHGIYELASRWVTERQKDAKSSLVLANQLGERLARLLDVEKNDINLLVANPEGEAERYPLGTFKAGNFTRREDQRWPFTLEGRISAAGVGFTFWADLSFGYKDGYFWIWMGEKSKQVAGKVTLTVSGEVDSAIENTAQAIIDAWAETLVLSGDWEAFEQGKRIVGFSPAE